MSTDTFARPRALAVLGVTATLALTACGGPSASPSMPDMPGMQHSTMPSPSAGQSSSMPGMDGMSGMDDMPTGDGLTDQASGFRLTLLDSSLPAGQPGPLRFRITSADGQPVTRFQEDQTKLMHFYLIRTDLTGFQHIHPTMAPDGTWTAPLEAAAPGSYRAYAQFITPDASGKPVSLVLSQQITVPGTAARAPLPPVSSTAEVDGYTLTLQGEPMSGMSHPLTVTVTKNGRPVTDLQPYLDTYAHLTAFHDGDLAFAHLHPQGTVNGDHGGPQLQFDAMFPKNGTWRLFLQFQTGGVLHTAAVTVPVS